MEYGNTPPSAEQIAEALTSALAKDRLRAEDPELYSAFSSARQKEFIHSLVLAFPIGLIFAALFGSIGSSEFGNMPSPPGSGLISFIVFYGFGFALSYGAATKWGESEHIITEFKNKMHRDFRKDREMQRKMGDAISEIAEKEFGYTLIAESGSTVISGNTDSTIFNNSVSGDNYLKNTGDFINGIKEKEPDLADAMAVLTALVEKSGKEEAVDALDNLRSALAQEKRKPSIIRAIWNDLVSLLPEAAAMTSAAATISKVITG